MEIFFEKGLFSKQAPVHCTVTANQLPTEGKDQGTEEDDVIELSQELFTEDPVNIIQPRTETHIMALTKEGQLVDPVCLIRPATAKGGLSVKGSDYVRVKNVGRMSDYELLG